MYVYVNTILYNHIYLFCYLVCVICLFIKALKIIISIIILSKANKSALNKNQQK